MQLRRSQQSSPPSRVVEMVNTPSIQPLLYRIDKVLAHTIHTMMFIKHPVCCRSVYCLGSQKQSICIRRREVGFVKFFSTTKGNLNENFLGDLGSIMEISVSAA